MEYCSRYGVAKAKGFSKILIESDFKLAIRFLDQGCQSTSSNAPLVREIKALIDKNPHVRWRDIYREANSVADSFAKNGLNLLSQMEIFYVPPVFSW